MWGGCPGEIFSSCVVVVWGASGLHFFCFLFCFPSAFLLSSSTRKRFYPQRSSGQAVVTGVVRSPPRYVPSIFIAHRVQYSHCSSIFIECCQLTLSRSPLIHFYARKSPYVYVHSVIIELTKLILVGTRKTYQAILYNIHTYMERCDRPWVTLNLCEMRRHYLGEGYLVSP